MDKVHPLTEIVARAIFEAQERGDDPNVAAIRAVLTFEPTADTLVAVLHSDKWADVKGASEQRLDPADAYRAMTAALLKEVEGE